MASLMEIVGLGKQVKEPIEAIGNVFDELFTSDDERNASAVVMEKLRQEPLKLQTAINQIEAQHRSLFVAGWRPFIGWTCGVALFLYYIPQFVVASILWIKLSWASETIIAYPIENISGLAQLIFGILGMGGLRTIEKITGKTK